MLFNSYEFIFVFLPIAVAGYFFLGNKENKKLANIWLVFASLCFYSYWEIKYLPILLGSILFNYYISGIIIKYRKDKEKKKLKQRIFWSGILVNALLLGYFKYTDFFIDNINLLSGGDIPLLHLMLPLGISFFTITQMVYLVDCYEGVAKDHDFTNYALFVSFFPHLLAGPILYHKAMMKQFGSDTNKAVQWENMDRGFTLFIIGLAKKVLIADVFMNYANPGFADPAQLNTVEAWLISISYMLQLYFDFSGYSDMAVGVAQMMNIKIPLNFNSPYKAKGMIDFWQRWHMSLTSTITNYLYTPILMQFKKMTFRDAMIATFLAMFIAGIWHGAGWTFIIFGTMHAAGIVVNHIWKHYHLPMNVILGRFITLLWVLLAFVFFRAENVADACCILQAMFNPGAITMTDTGLLPKRPDIILRWIAGAAVVLAIAPNSNEIVKKFKPNIYWMIGLLIVFTYVILNMGNYTEFLYFQF